MAFDRRFWSGAAIAVTVVIAGANALPALLLSPPVDSSPVIAVRGPALAPVVTDPSPTQVAPQAVSDAAPPPVIQAAPAPVVAATPAPAPPVVPPQPVVAAAPQSTIPAPPAPAESTEAFPPVQPLNAEPAPPTSASLTTTPARGTEKTARTKERRTEPKERKATRLRPVRPAIYPLREFFAWTR